MFSHIKIYEEKFIIAVLTDNYHEMQWLLNINASIVNTFIDKDRNTAFHIAALNDNRNLILILSTHNADYEIRNAQGKNVIDIIVEKNTLDLIPIIEKGNNNPQALKKLNRALIASHRKASTLPLELENLFFRTVDTGDVDQVISLINSGIPIDTINKSGQTALHFAVQNQATFLIKALIKNGANINILDEDRNTPTQVAIKNLKFKIAELISDTAHIYQQLQNEKFAKYAQAVLSADIPTIKECLEENTFINKPIDYLQNSALHVAFSKKNIELIACLVIYTPSLSLTNECDTTPIDIAILNNFNEGIEILIQSGKYKNNQELSKILIHLINTNKYDQEKDYFFSSLAAASDPTVTLKNENTALHCAVAQNMPPLVTLLLKHGYDSSIKNYLNQTPFELAIIEEKFECATVLQPNENDIYSKLLFNAVELNNEALAFGLLKAGATIVNNQIIFNAIATSNSNLVKIFLAQIPLTTLNEDEFTPISYAANKQQWEMVMLLILTYLPDMREKIKTIPEEYMEDFYQLDIVLLAALKEKRNDIIELIAPVSPLVCFFYKKNKPLWLNLLEDPEYNETFALLANNLSTQTSTRSRAIIGKIKEALLPLPEFVKYYFQDPIFKQTITNPVINPSGDTYDEKCITSLMLDEPITWISNQLVKELITYYKHHHHSTTIPPLLFNAAGELYKEPVVTVDGNTHEKRLIEESIFVFDAATGVREQIVELKNDGWISPGVKQDGPLYPNQLISNLIKEVYLIPALINAIKTNDITGFYYFITFDFDINIALDPEQNTLSHCILTTENQNPSFITGILKKNPNLLSKNSNDISPFELLIDKNYVVIIHDVITYYLRTQNNYLQLVVNNISPAALDNLVNILAHTPFENLLQKAIQQKNTTGLTREFILREYFIDPIFLDELKNPMITQDGITFSQTSIEQMIKNKIKNNPVTHRPINFDLVIPNSLAADLINYYNQPGVNVSHIPPCLICSKTNKVFENAVVDATGKTYSEKNVPAEVAKKGSLRPNYFVRKLILELKFDKKNSIAQTFTHFSLKTESSSTGMERDSLDNKRKFQ